MGFNKTLTDAKKKMTAGAQLYSLREFCRTPDGVRETFDKVKKIGYDNVQVSGICKLDCETLRDISEEAGLPVIVTHTPPDRIINETGEVIREHKVFNCSNIGIGSMPERFSYSPEGIRAFIKEFAPAMQKIRDAGLKFTYHNHCSEYQKSGGRTLMSLFAEETEKYGMNFTLDTYWVHAGGYDVVKQINELKGRIEVCHFKDMVIYGEEQRIAPVGSGNLNFEAITKACYSAGVKYVMVEQDFFYGADEFDCMKLSYNYLKEIL